MATIRELFHNLGNKHNVITIGCGATQEVINECLASSGLTEEIRNNLLEIKNSLEKIIKSTLEADKIATEIHDRVYVIIDPDTEKVKKET